MYETLSQLATLGKAMWKYRWHGVLVAWVWLIGFWILQIDILIRRPLYVLQETL